MPRKGPAAPAVSLAGCVPVGMRTPSGHTCWCASERDVEGVILEAHGDQRMGPRAGKW